LFNKILQTGLQGNFSSALQKRIKDYLLPEGKDIGGHITEMQEHMRLCRSSRLAVQRLDEKIQTVEDLYKKTMAMIGRAAATVRLCADELRRKYAETLKIVSDLRGDKQRHEIALTQVRNDTAGAKLDLEQRDKTKSAAIAAREKAERSHSLSIEIAGLSSEFEIADSALSTAKAKRDRALAQRELVTKNRNGLSEQHADICGRLADAQQHWQKVSMEAGLFEGATNALGEAKMAMRDHDVSQVNAQALLEESTSRERNLAKELTILRRETENAESERGRFYAVLDLVAKLAERSIDPADGQRVAAEIIGAHETRTREIIATEGLDEKLRELKLLATRQENLKLALKTVESHGVVVTQERHLSQAHEKFTQEHKSFEADLQAAENELLSLRVKQKELASNKANLELTVANYEGVLRQRAKFEQRYGCQLASTEAIDELLKEMDGRRGQASRNQYESECEAGRLREEIKKVHAVHDVAEEGVSKAINGRRLISAIEEIEIDDPADYQAMLGPLVDAYIVEDIDAALQSLDVITEAPDEIWLLDRAKFKLKDLRGQRLKNYVAVATETGVRATKLPQFPRIGHKSRKAYAEHLQKLRRNAETRVTEARIEANELSRDMSELQKLSGQLAALPAGDLRLEIDTVKHKIHENESAIKAAEDKIRPLRGVVNKLGELVDHLVKLLPEGHLLDRGDLQQECEGVAAQIESGKLLRKLHDLKAPLVQELEKKRDSLRYLPLTDADIARMNGRLAQLEVELAYWSTARQSLTTLVDRLEHFKYEESHHSYLTREDPTKGLKDLLTTIAQQVEEVDKELKTTEELLEAHNGDLNTCDAKLKEIQAHLDSKKQQLVLLGVPGTDEFLAEAKSSEFEATDAYERSHETLVKLEESAKQIEKELEETNRKLNEAEKNFTQCRANWKPASVARRRVEHLRKTNKSLADLNVHIDDLCEKYGEAFLASDLAKESWVELRNTVESVEHDGTHPLRVALASSPRWNLHIAGKDSRVETVWAEYCDAWSLAQDYVAHIIPQDIVASGNPGHAVEEMRRKHRALMDTLADAEQRFQTSAQNVAKSIRQQIAEERRGVNKNNAQLESISFGGLSGIKIFFSPREDMMRLLDYMENKEQWDLFARDEIDRNSEDGDQALGKLMEKLYSRITGGKTEAHLLLDYRNYIDMQVQVRRKGSDKWTVASNLSTGEAMGTGTAILMVVLQTWEKQVFSRDNDLQSNLRFLFVDEASRLDPKSIQTLLEFCRIMDVQLLVAGPNFSANETGSGITYRLVRKFEQGGELVVIRGRKGFGDTTEDEVA